MFKRLLSYLFQGLLLTAPLVITFYVIYWLFYTLDNTLNDLIAEALLARYPDLNVYRFPGVGIVIGIVLITIIGFLSNTFILKPLFYLVERLLSQTPLVKIIYSSLRDLFSAFVGNNKFKKPVLVNIAGTNMQRMGFLTQEDLENLGLKDKVAVYLPHSYNFSGNLFIFNSSDITPLDISTTDAMKFIVSGGVSDVNESENDSEATATSAS